MDWCQQWRQPIVSNFNMGIKENNYFTEDILSSYISTPDQTFPFLVSDYLDVAFVHWFIQLIVQSQF